MGVGSPQQRGELYCPTCEQTFVDGERCPTDNTRLVRIAAQHDDALIGRELDKRYTIVEKLGQGGMGAVYRGTQHSVGREVAIKVVTPTLVSDAVVIKRFLREAKLASRLSHPNAVAVLDFGQTDDGLFYLVMELVTGRTLEALLEAERTLAPSRIVRIGAQICDALEGAHALNIVHRDLKPQNVMVISTGRDLVKVLDFGLAKSLTPDPQSATMTNAGAVLGTPAYMPPEVMSGEPSDARGDLYSLGCMLYVCATGQLPFESTSMHELIAMHACEPVPPITGVPPKLAAVIGRLLEKRREDRFQSAAETRDALETSLAGEYANTAPKPAVLSTRLGWNNSATPLKGDQRTRIGTPVSGVPVVARAAPSGPVVSRAASPTPPSVAPSEPAVVQFATQPAVEPKRSRAKAVLIGSLVGLAIGAVAFVAIKKSKETDSSPATSPAPTQSPTPAPTATAPSVSTKPEPVAPPTTKPEPVAPSPPATKPEPVAPSVSTTKPEPKAAVAPSPPTTKSQATAISPPKNPGPSVVKPAVKPIAKPVKPGEAPRLPPVIVNPGVE